VDPNVRKRKPVRDEEKTTINVGGRTKLLSNLAPEQLDRMLKDLKTQLARTYSKRQ
jgi:hypothetical protein